MPRGNAKNLIPNSARTPEELKKITQKGGKASGKARREKKRVSEVYADYLAKKHDIQGKDGIEKLEGHKLLSKVISKVLSRGDSASVSMMKEMREAIEGNTLNLEGETFVEIIIEGVEPEPDNGKD